MSQEDKKDYEAPQIKAVGDFEEATMDNSGGVATEGVYAYPYFIPS